MKGALTAKLIYMFLLQFMVSYCIYVDKYVLLGEFRMLFVWVFINGKKTY